MKFFQNKKATSLMVLILMFTLTTGCANRSKSSYSTTTNAAGQTVVHESNTTTASDPAPDRGILGGAFHVVGEILAFPFEIIAGAFRFIF